MSPSEVFEMDDELYHSFVEYMRDEVREMKRAQNKRRH
jgi:hypothetical protein